MIAALVLAATISAPTPAMLAPVQRWIAAFNALQTPLPQDVFTDDAVITDQFAPYVWNGAAGIHAWSQRLETGMHSPRVAFQHVVTDAPRAFMISKDGDRVSFVLPATLTYKVDGKEGVDRALWLYVVVKQGDVWKIAADTWTRTD
jgi:ketosteroid isomerase-like protein